MDSLGLTINLYFKLIKYLQWLVFAMFAINLFPMLLYMSGDAYTDLNQAVIPMNWLAMLSIGNLNIHQKVICSQRNQISNFENKTTELTLKCPDGGYVLKDLKQYL